MTNPYKCAYCQQDAGPMEQTGNGLICTACNAPLTWWEKLIWLIALLISAAGVGWVVWQLIKLIIARLE